jgi:hypothetical protein
MAKRGEKLTVEQRQQMAETAQARRREREASNICRTCGLLVAEGTRCQLCIEEGCTGIDIMIGADEWDGETYPSRRATLVGSTPAEALDTWQRFLSWWFGTWKHATGGLEDDGITRTWLDDRMGWETYTRKPHFMPTWRPTSRFDADFRAEVCRLREQGFTVRQAASRMGISASQICRIEKQSKESAA